MISLCDCIAVMKLPSLLVIIIIRSSLAFYSVKVTDGEVEAIRPLPWYPENLAWQSNFSRMQLRKNQTLER
jgi:hypothetical protein